jgi:hypothetical protein
VPRSREHEAGDVDAGRGELGAGLVGGVGVDRDLAALGVDRPRVHDRAARGRQLVKLVVDLVDPVLGAPRRAGEREEQRDREEREHQPTQMGEHEAQNRGIAPY